MQKSIKSISILLFGLVLALSSVFTPVASANENLFANKKERHPNLDESRLELNKSIAEQMQVLEGKGVIDKDLDKATGDVRVIVHYKQPSVALERGLKMSKSKKWSGLSDKEVQDKIQKQQDKAEANMVKKRVKFQVNKKFETVINASSMTVNAKDLNTLASVPDVALIEKDDVISIDPNESVLNNLTQPGVDKAETKAFKVNEKAAAKADSNAQKQATKDAKKVAKDAKKADKKAAKEEKKKAKKEKKQAKKDKGDSNADEDDEVAPEPDDSDTPVVNSPEYIASISHLNIPKVWDLGNKGKGIKVGVIDTGIDYNHPDLKDVYKGGRNYVEGTDYLVKRDANDPYETKPDERPSHLPEKNDNGSDYFTTHGTHVAGTIAAQGKNKYGVIGIAPNVELHAYRVLGAYGSGLTSWIVGGVEGSVNDGMDVINLSLGNSSPEENQANAFAVSNAMLMGTTAAVATGNSGPNRSTIGGPATSPMAISVGNTTLPELNVASNVTLSAGDFKETFDANFMAFELGVHPKEQLEKTMKVVAIPSAGKVEDFNGVDVTGKVALIQRGDIAFVEKIFNAKAQGATGVIIYNSATGSNTPNAADIFLGRSFDYLPTLDISHTVGKAFNEAIANVGQGEVTFNTFTDSKTAGDEMNNSSSRGPSKPNFDIKPDVSAPGTNVLSSVPVFQSVDPTQNYEKAFDSYTGTSMATPHIAAISALLLEIHPEWTPFDVKSALSNTAKQLDTQKFDVFSQGAGLVQPYEAATTKALLKVEHNSLINGKDHLHTRGTMAFGNVAPKDTEQKIVKELKIENLDGGSDKYTFDVQVTKAATGDIATTSLTPESNEVTINKSGVVKFTLTVPAGKGGTNNEMLGYIKVKGGNGNFSLPFAVNLSEKEKSGFAQFALTDNHVSPNADGVKDTVDLNVKTNSPQTYTLISYFDLLDSTNGPKGDGYVGDIIFEPGLNGSKTYKLDGKMYNLVDSKRIDGELEDGVYSVESFSTSALGYTNPYDYPLFVKRTATKVSDVKLDNGKLVGQVDDLYVNALNKLKAEYNLNYTPKDVINSTYTLDANKTGSVVINEDKTMTADFADVQGTHHLTLNFEDAAGNKAEYKYTVDFDKGEVKEGHLEIKDPEVPVDPENPEDPETPVVEGYRVPLSSIISSVTKDKVKQVVVNVPESAIVNDSATVIIDRNVLNNLVTMKADKKFFVNVGGQSIELNVDNFKQVATSQELLVKINKVDAKVAGQVTDVYDFSLVRVAKDGKQTVVNKLNTPFTVYINAPKHTRNVAFDVLKNKAVTSTYKVNKQQYSINGQPSQYVIVR